LEHERAPSASGVAVRESRSEVKEPKRVPFTADLTVLGSINAAGGFLPFADQRKVRLLRNSDVQIIDVK
jgi:protein involved in polysaccharide export with SLBB domain